MHEEKGLLRAERGPLEEEELLGVAVDAVAVEPVGPVKEVRRGEGERLRPAAPAAAAAWREEAERLQVREREGELRTAASLVRIGRG